MTLIRVNAAALHPGDTLDVKLPFHVNRALFYENAKSGGALFAQLVTVRLFVAGRLVNQLARPFSDFENF